MPAGTVDVPGLLTRFSREHPGIEVSLIEGTAADMVSHLANDELDVAFCLLAGTEPAGLAVEQIGHDEVVAIFAPDVAPALPDVSVSDLEAHPVIALRRGSVITSVVEGLFGREGSRLTLTLESGDPFLLRSLAAQGFATAIVPRSLTALEGPPIEVRSLRPVVRLPVALVWRSDRTLSPAASRFIHHVRDEIEGTGRRRRTGRTVGA